MTSPSTNPRRCHKTRPFPTSPPSRPASPQHADSPIEVDGIVSPLKKSSTFHSRRSPPAEGDPIVSIPLLSKRSVTSSKDLEDAVAAGEARMANLIGQLDRSLSGLESAAADSPKPTVPDDLPVPRFMLDAHVTDPSHMDVDKPEAPKAPRRKHHTSDSGIGSTITASDEPASNHGSHPSLINEVRSGINGNRSLSGATGNQHALSSYACRQIQKHIIIPILKEGTLKEFHGLVKGIPLRVGRKEITCLRDLEKVLLWLAPKFTTSRSSFVRFGETTIQCLHTTVPHLNEADLRKPADRPYTNGYFLDLTEQVRQYAAMISAARERRANGDATDDDPTSDERLVLHGGLTENGRPAELARMRGDQLISLRTGEPIDEDAVVPRFATDAEREEYQLSMARRRKGAPERVNHRCSECKKEFKRPCDLTKHEKTHSRPWKCSDLTCKYHSEGWPTEKERDRHINDKHKAAPVMHKCHFHPCPYESKRQSNCKQHMEKAHGWAYIRSKNNGKPGKTQPDSKSPHSPGSNIFNMGLDGANSPYARTHSRATSIDTTSVSSPYLGVAPGMYGGYGNGYPTEQRQGPSPALTPSPHNLTIDTSTANASVPSSSYGTSHSDIDQPLFGDSFDWSNLDFSSDFTSMNIQLHTPATSIDSSGLNNYPHTRNQSLSFTAPIKNHPNLSPGAQGGAMLYSPYEQPLAHDEGFHEFAMTEAGKPTNDFPLFDSRPASSLSQQSGMLFAGLPNFAASIWTQQPNQSFEVDDVMQQ